MMMNGMGGFGGFIPPIKQAQGMQQPGIQNQIQPSQPGQMPNVMQYLQQQQLQGAPQGSMMGMLQQALRNRGGGFAGGMPWMQMGR